MDNKTIVAMLDHVGARPVVVCGYDESHFWRVANVDNNIYVQRTRFSGSIPKFMSDEEFEPEETDSVFSSDDKGLKRDTFNAIVQDFVLLHAEEWNAISADEDKIACDIADINDADFQSILKALGKTNRDFLKSAKHWYSYIGDLIGSRGKIRFENASLLNSKERSAKNVMKKFRHTDPLVVIQGSITFEWNLIQIRDEIFYSRLIYKDYEKYINCTEEYGRVAIDDEDQFGALRDAVASSFMVDGWSFDKKSKCNPEELLKIVGLSLNTI